MSDTRSQGGWTVVAETDGAAHVLGAIVALDPGAVYTKSTLADRAGVPLKTLFLAETLDVLDRAGLLERVDDPTDETEARYRIDDDCPLYDAACAFEEAADAPERAVRGID